MEKVTNNAARAGPGQTCSLLLCCDRCRLCLFFLTVPEAGHPTTENDNKKNVNFGWMVCVYSARLESVLKHQYDMDLMYLIRTRQVCD